MIIVIYAITLREKKNLGLTTQIDVLTMIEMKGIGQCREYDVLSAVTTRPNNQLKTKAHLISLSFM